MKQRPNILFLCTGNSCRSQMAEGWARRLLGQKFNIFSAGLEKHGLNPYAVQAMAEQGVDISSHFSKTLEDLNQEQIDVVITVCGHADETCPVFPGSTRKIHHGFDDPPKLAASAQTDQEKMLPYRRVCLEIKAFIESLESQLGLW